jgi:hypothetical protein
LHANRRQCASVIVGLERFFASDLDRDRRQRIRALHDRHVLDVGVLRDRPVVQHAVRPDRPRMEAVDRDLHGLFSIRARASSNSVPGSPAVDNSPSCPPRFAASRATSAPARGCGAVRLVDQRQRRDHAIAGPVVRGEDLQPAARPQALDPAVALEHPEPLREPGDRSTNPAAWLNSKPAWSRDAAAISTSAVGV